MRIVTFLTNLGLGGTEKAACRWAWGLTELGHQVTLLTLADGPRHAELQQHSIPFRVVEPGAGPLVQVLKEIKPDLIHAHAPGHPYPGDVLGEALALFPKKIPVVQTNIFGHLWNRKEDAWTDFRLFISWTSCVQAAWRNHLRVDEIFFRQNSVAVYPLDSSEPASPNEIAAFRQRYHVADDEVLFGRFSRPDPAKWTDLALNAFRLASKRSPRIKLLLREPPPQIAAELRASPDVNRFVILPATGDPAELRLTMSAIDAGLHTSSIGESFGYGIAELMNLRKPVITHSVPWHDQAQIELVRHGECGLVASTPAEMAQAICKIAADAALRERMGATSQRHIRHLANPETSLARMEKVFQTVLAGGLNPFATGDLSRAKETAAYLKAQQFGHSISERFSLMPRYYQAKFYRWRASFKRGG